MTTTTQTVPDQHSNLVGGSTAARRIECSASYVLEQKVPKDKGSQYANEGTTLHEMMTILLLDPEKEPYDLIPFHFKHKDGWEYTVNDQIWEDLGQPALDAFLDYMDKVEAQEGAELKYVVEQKCEFPGIPGAFGTSDIVWRCGRLAGVWDWKFGFGQVKAEDNAQLLFYAAAARHTHPKFFEGAEEIDLAIMQPQRSDEPDVWTVGPGALDEFQDTLYDAIRQVRLVEMGAAEPRHVKGDHCKFATCKAICPLWVNPTAALAEKLGLRKDDEKTAADEYEPLKDHEAFGDEPTFLEMLPDLLELAEIGRDFADEVFKRAQALALDNPPALEIMEAHGWGLKPKRAGNLAWIESAEKVKKGLMRRGLKADEYAPRKLMTPTQAKKALEKLGKELPEDWAARPPSSGATLDRLSEDKERYQTHAQKARALAERLGVSNS